MVPIVQFKSHVSLSYRLNYGAIGAVLTGFACVLAFPMVTYMDRLPIWGAVLALLGFTIAAWLPLPFWLRSGLKLKNSAILTDGKLTVMSGEGTTVVELNAIRGFIVRLESTYWGGKLYVVCGILHSKEELPVVAVTELCRAERIKRQLGDLILPDRQPDHHSQ
jgi:hypothetical protein